ncbi:hypothetical protein VL806_14875 [Listeria seeligeri]|uniref:hypothetical protein n=1 Tax=Listeria seeligeri TaxID=1640 RepID=UPI0018B0CF2B|nr:hypothetical protein [Listeria seeligeri]QPJ27878.1 hypothetical protein IMX23_06940 [Listeria seeligeri]
MIDGKQIIKVILAFSFCVIGIIYVVHLDVFGSDVTNSTKKEMTSKDKENKNARKVNQAFLQAFFTYDDSKEIVHSKKYLTSEALDEAFPSRVAQSNVSSVLQDCQSYKNVRGEKVFYLNELVIESTYDGQNSSYKMILRTVVNKNGKISDIKVIATL